MTNTAAGPLGGASQSAGPHTGSGSQDYNAELFSSILADHKYEIESRAFTAASLGPSPAPVEKPLPSFWLETSADPGPADGVFGTDAPLDSDVDVAIIGSGITGISAAYQLAHKLTPPYEGQQPRVAVIEARDFCSGATGRNGGHCTPVSVLSYKDLAADQEHLSRFLGTSQREEHWGNDVGVKTDETVRKVLTLEARTAAELLMIVRMAGVRARKAQAANPVAAPVDDVEFVSGSNWHICQSKEEEELFDESIEAAKRAGLSDFAMQVRKVPEAEWKQRLNEPEKITAAYEIPGSTVHPRRLVILLQKLAHQTAERAGLSLKVFTHTPVTQIIPASAPGETALVKTSRGDVKARYVIHASNAYVSHLLPQLAGHSGVVPTRAQCLSMVPTHSPAPSEPLWQMGFSLNHGYEYLQQRPRPSPGQSAPPCILGGGRWAAKNMEFGIADDSEINPDVSNVLRPLLPSVFPHNFDKDSKPDMEWTGIIGYTKTSDPFVGPVLKSGAIAGAAAATKPSDILPGQYVAAGYSGHGMTRAYSCAEILADMIVADRAGVLWVPPAWFPLSYLTAYPPSPTKTAASTGPADMNGQCDPAGEKCRGEPYTSFSLLAAGSNSGGQLGLGHDLDTHSWAQVLCDDTDADAESEGDDPIAGTSRTPGSSSGKGPPRPFPPPGHQVLQMSTGGANHTLALVGPTHEATSSLKFARGRVWVCGDGTNGQLGPEKPGTSGAQSDTSSLETIFRPMHDPQWLKLTLLGQVHRGWAPKLVAASWENSFVVYECTRADDTAVEGLRTDEEAASSAAADDVIFSFGSTNDFGQSGRGHRSSESSTSTDEPLSLPVPTREEVLRDPATGCEWKRSSKVRIERLAAGVRHVLLLATWSERLVGGDAAAASQRENGSRRRAALIGWGAARHGQLGSGPFPSIEGVTDTKSRFPLKRQKQSLPTFVGTPHRIHTWTIPDSTTGARQGSPSDVDSPGPVLSAGREHSALLVPPGWILDASPDQLDAGAADRKEARDVPPQDGERLFLFGSNRNGQLNVAGAAAASSPQGPPLESVWVGCTWNSTLLLLRSKETPDELWLAASGKNDKGQLGTGSGAAAEADDASPSYHLLPQDRFLDHTSGRLVPDGPQSGRSQGELDVLTHCGSEHTLLLLRQHSDSLTKGGRENPAGGDTTQVWGWGWNEHGNLALSSSSVSPDTGHATPGRDAQSEQEEEGEDQPVPIRLDMGLEARKGGCEPVSIWAGCATSFVQVRR